MKNRNIDIDDLIEIVKKGGKVSTGIDVYNQNKILLLARDVMVTRVKALEIIKENGVKKVPLITGENSGIWDEKGKAIQIEGDKPKGLKELKSDFSPVHADAGIEKKLMEIEEIKKMAGENYKASKKCIRKAFDDTKASGGQFDHNEVSSHVKKLYDFLAATNNPFSYLSKEILSFDDYLYNHSINVCATATTVLNKFNDNFSAVINKHLNAENKKRGQNLVKKPDNNEQVNSYKCFLESELQDISLGFFLHDIGMVMVPEDIKNKSGKLTDQEYDTVKRHSKELGITIMEKNKLNNPFLMNTVKYHHAPIFEGEERCYPLDRIPADINLYVKICRLADIFDAMTSKRSYKEAGNQINVVTEVFRMYAKKDNLLQFILHSFISSIGIYPPGSIIFLRNGQMGYVLESSGPLVLPFTDTSGNTLKTKPDPIDISTPGIDSLFLVDMNRSVKKPLDVYDCLPSYLKPKTAA
ncbi:MAG: HD domain-containing protein [Desulfobacteraceae bacterium]|nr:HD domain-containing protein [Desulfobacteraceae bacterium]